jgi:glycosyltransferase involved in cell wall biosynthesis
MQDEESVSFVVIAYNEEDHVAQTLDAITRLDGLGEHEIIVVDDCSRDSTARIVTDISKHNPHVRPVNLQWSTPTSSFPLIGWLVPARPSRATMRSAELPYRTAT